MRTGGDVQVYGASMPGHPLTDRPAMAKTCSKAADPENKKAA